VHTLYNFHFLRTVSAQLVEVLEALPVTQLNSAALVELRAYQSQSHSTQGVYLLNQAGAPVYLGKADNVAERLEQHFFKLTGRKAIELASIGYKCILLDESMGTAANEEILIRMFQVQHFNLWNGSGFGSKDPGKERDKTKPGRFDQQHPINEFFPVNFYGQRHTVEELLETAKRQLPYVFRIGKLSAELLSRQIFLPETNMPAVALLDLLVHELSGQWQATILSFGIILYEKHEDYPFGRIIRAT
jgi:hypothetical protein